MNYQSLTYEHYSVRCQLSSYVPQVGVAEYNAILYGTDTTLTFDAQLRNIIAAYNELKASLPDAPEPVMMRFFLSDPTNQAYLMPADMPCAVSVIGQAPLNGAKVALWIYMLTQMEHNVSEGGLHTYRHGEYRHIWMGSATSNHHEPRAATIDIFGRYDRALGAWGCGLAANCMRTWLLVRDVDVNYRGVVDGRNFVFDIVGLTPKSHFIASTGISGTNADPQVTVTMDAYAVRGLRPKQIRYLKAPEYLNPTAEYGVAFERGTAIEYGDRRHILISGTASINNRGEVMYPHDIRLQCERMMLNVKALVEEGGCSMDDLTHMIIYLRDIADYETVRDIFDKYWGQVPRVIVFAPVCRPGWLIEVECMAIGSRGNGKFTPL